MLIKLKVVATIIFFSFFSNSFGQKAPAPVTTAIFVKVLSFEKKTSSGDLNLYIIGAPDVAAELKKIVGKKVGDITIKSVESGDKLPTSVPNAIFNDNPSLAESVNKYCKANKIISLTRNKDIPTDGITILVDLTDDGKPLILINASASVAQSLEWNPAIFKIAKKL